MMLNFIVLHLLLSSTENSPSASMAKLTVFHCSWGGKLLIGIKFDPAVCYTHKIESLIIKKIVSIFKTIFKG